MLASPAGPSTLTGGATLVARNIPLVVLLVLIGMMFWPMQRPDDVTVSDQGDDDLTVPTDVRPDPVPNGLHRDTA